MPTMISPAARLLKNITLHFYFDIEQDEICFMLIQLKINSS